MGSSGHSDPGAGEPGWPPDFVLSLVHYLGRFAFYKMNISASFSLPGYYEDYRESLVSVFQVRYPVGLGLLALHEPAFPSLAASSQGIPPPRSLLSWRLGLTTVAGRPSVSPDNPILP